MFYAINGIKLKPGVREEFVRLLEPNARGASNEPGCISFNVIQDNSNPDVLWFIEAYEQEKDFEDHQQTLHFKTTAHGTFRFASVVNPASGRL